jgi:hypothetical protein
MKRLFRWLRRTKRGQSAIRALYCDKCTKRIFIAANFEHECREIK